MLNTVLSFLTQGVSAVFGWFNQITSSVPGVIPFMLAFFTMYVIFRTLIVPLVGRRYFGFTSHEDRGSDPNSKFSLPGGRDGYYMNGKKMS